MHHEHCSHKTIQVVAQNEAAYIVKDSTYHTYSFKGRPLAVSVLVSVADDGEKDSSHRDHATDEIQARDTLSLENSLKNNNKINTLKEFLHAFIFPDTPQGGTAPSLSWIHQSHKPDQVLEWAGELRKPSG